MGTELYTEFALCQQLPLHLIREVESLTNAIAIAMKERRINDARILKLRRSALGCNPLGTTSADMVIRLQNLKSLLDGRYDDHVATENCDGGEICIEYQDRIQTILDSTGGSIKGLLL